jgi:hypothetical protein
MRVSRDERPARSRCGPRGGGGRDLGHQLVAGLDRLTERTVVSGRATIEFKHAVTSEKFQSGPRTPGGRSQPRLFPRSYGNSDEDEHITDRVVEFEPLAEQHNCQD